MTSPIPTRKSFNRQYGTRDDIQLVLEAIRERENFIVRELIVKGQEIKEKNPNTQVLICRGANKPLTEIDELKKLLDMEGGKDYIEPNKPKSSMGKGIRILTDPL